MSSIARNWSQSFDIVQQQIEQFNKTVQASDNLEAIDKLYSPEKLKEIHKIVKKETERLEELASRLEKRINKLNQGCCGCSGWRSPAIKITIGLSVVSKIFTIAGGFVAVFSPEPVSKYIGLGFMLGGECFDSATTIYSTKSQLELQELADLSQINKDGVLHAERFQSFLKELKEIKKIQKAQFKQMQEASQLIIDKKIGDCLKNYEKLGCYQNDEVYFRLLSVLIQHLPDEDPLKEELNSLKPLQRVTDITLLAEKPLPIVYLPTKKKTEQDDSSEKPIIVEIKERITQEDDLLESSSEKPIIVELKERSTQEKKQDNLLESSSDQSIILEPKEKWVGEKHSRFEEQVEILDPLQEKESYGKRLAHYKHTVAQRFGIRKNIEFFDLPQGVRLANNGFKPIPVIIDQQSEEQMTEKEQITIRIDTI